MIDVQRWTIHHGWSDSWPVEDPEGGFITYADHARIVAEVDAERYADGYTDGLRYAAEADAAALLRAEHSGYHRGYGEGAQDAAAASRTLTADDRSRIMAAVDAVYDEYRSEAMVALYRIIHDGEA